MVHAQRAVDDDEIAAAISAFEASLPFALDHFQREAIEKLERSRGVLVAAPTSSGKTLVAEYPMWRCLLAPPELRRAHARVIYTSPLKALSNQKYHDLSERYGPANIGLVTGEHTINDGAAVVVMTTEILRNVLYDEPARLDLVSDVVLDEVHYIDDYPPGHRVGGDHHRSPAARSSDRPVGHDQQRRGGGRLDARPSRRDRHGGAN